MKFSFDFAYRSIEGGEVNIGETKTEKGTRTILLPKGTLKILTERKKNSVSEWIFSSLLNPEKPTSPSSAYHRLKVILKGAGLPDIRFHDLRHTFATHALTSGVDAKTLSGILGHVSSATTLDIYSHITDEMQKSAANKIEKHFAKKEPFEHGEYDNGEVPEKAANAPCSANFEPNKGKIRKAVTGGIYQISDNLFEGRYSPTNAHGKREVLTVHAKAKEECEKLLEEKIPKVRARLRRKRYIKTIVIINGRINPVRNRPVPCQERYDLSSFHKVIKQRIFFLK